MREVSCVSGCSECIVGMKGHVEGWYRSWLDESVGECERERAHPTLEPNEWISERPQVCTVSHSFSAALCSPNQMSTSRLLLLMWTCSSPNPVSQSARVIAKEGGKRFMKKHRGAGGSFTRPSTCRKQIITGCIMCCSIMSESTETAQTAECAVTACVPIVKRWLYSMIPVMTDMGIFFFSLGWYLAHFSVWCF